MNNMKAKKLRSVSIISNSSNMLNKYLTIIGLTPILSFGVTIMHVINDEIDMRLILFINGLVLFCITLFLIYYAFVEGIFKSFNLLAKMSSENSQLSSLGEGEAIINIRELNKNSFSTVATFHYEL